MRPEYIFGPLLAVFLVVQIVRRLRGRPNDTRDDCFLDCSETDDDDDELSDDA